MDTWHLPRQKELTYFHETVEIFCIVSALISQRGSQNSLPHEAVKREAHQFHVRVRGRANLLWIARSTVDHKKSRIT